MFAKNPDNQILPFFFTFPDVQNQALQYLSFVSKEGYTVFVVASLFSEHIEDIERYLTVGVEEVKKRFIATDLPVLDRMKASIFQAGDYLAGFLVQEKQPVDDVDFSVCLLCMKDGLMYAWIDGDLNVRVYRGKDSIVINPERKPQFFGSMQIELGDIFSVSYADYLLEYDERFEDYVLEKETPEYPALFIDYQVEPEEIVEEEVRHIEDVSVIEPEPELVEEALLEDLPSNESVKPLQTVEKFKPGGRENKPLREPVKAFANGNEKLKLIKDRSKQTIGKITSSSSFATAKHHSKNVLLFVWNILMNITSVIIDTVYKAIFRKNQHQIKRFQSSYNKRYLQYLMIFVMLISTVYFVFVKGSGEKSAGGQKVAGSKTESDYRQEIQGEFDKLTQYYNAVQVSNFSDSFGKLRQEAQAAKQAGFSDEAFINEKLTKAQDFEDTLLKVTPLKKVDETYLSNTIPNVNIVAFSVSGKDVYAVDRANSQILKGSSASPLQFQVFAGDPRLSAMSKISCSDTACYILDDNKGVAILTLASKTFVIAPLLDAASKGVTEMTFIFNRIYTLNAADGKIMRYDKQGEGIAAGAQWNKDAVDSNAVDFALESGIFTIDNTGVAKKFYQGKVDTDFAGLQASNPTLGAHLQIALTPARDPGPSIRNRFYVADADNKLIAVYDKDLNAQKQFPFKGVYKYRGTDKIQFSGFKDVILSNDENYLYILENNMVYKIQVSAI